MPRLHIDIESYGTVDLNKVGVYVYAHHPDTRIRIISCALDGGKATTPFNYEGQWPKSYKLEGLELGAHNAEFERVMLNGPPGRRIGFPSTDLRQWRCSAHKAAIHGLPRTLEKLLEALHLEERIDEGKHRNMMLLSKPIKRQKNKQTVITVPTPETHPEQWAKWVADCERDVLGERAVDLLLPDPIASEQRLYVLDQQINARGFWTNQKLVKKLIGMREEHIQSLVDECVELCGLNPTQREAVKGWLESKGIELDNLKAATVKENIHRHRVLEIRRETSKTSTAKLDRMVICAGNDDRVRGGHVIHGATPGRWTGKLVQTQNLPKPVIDEDFAVELAELLLDIDLETFRLLVDSVMDAMSSVLRSCIQAPKGRTLRVADFSAVESRIVAWLVGEEWKLEVFRGDGAIYEAVASRMFGIPLEEYRRYKKEHGHHHESRDLGKRTELACGYAGGKDAVKRSPGFEKIDPQPSDKEVQKWVDLWRSACEATRDSWKGFIRLIIRAIETQTVTSGYKCKFGMVTYANGMQFLRIQLPSKRSIYFAEPKVHAKEMYWNEEIRRFQETPVEGQKPKVIKEISHMTVIDGMWLRRRAHGGIILQNITEAVGRDLLVHGMFNLDDAGYPIIMHVHDEIVTETEEDFGSTEELVELMTDAPEWSAGLPLKAAGWSGPIFHKD